MKWFSSISLSEMSPSSISNQELIFCQQQPKKGCDMTEMEIQKLV
jgi:hypothetical protein